MSITFNFTITGYSHDQVTILTPYVGQILSIVREMKSRLSEVSAYVSDLDQEELLKDDGDDELEGIGRQEEKTGGKNVRCASIDNFQGEESDIVIISLV